MASRQMSRVAAALVSALVFSACPAEQPGAEPRDDGALSPDASSDGGGASANDAGQDAGQSEVDAGPPLDECAAPAGGLSSNDNPPGRLEIADVTGDGLRDVLSIADGDGGVVLSIGDAGTTILFDQWEVYAMFAAAYVNDDAEADLVTSSPWASEVRVFLGPLSGALRASDAAHLFTASNGPGAIENLFGLSFVVVDFNGDGVKDMVISTPGEGEEACFAQEEPRVWFGPFDGGVHGRHDADLLLRGPSNSCLGEAAACIARGFRLYEQRWSAASPLSRCHQWNLPTVDGGAAPCEG